ncbi:hypothetical protein DYB32_000593 [Aphanomyces invadans]|uniref:SAM domain-containing protein n=1 Tax=Aphanomyces invadans TaxID=157072 RepID=A0A3R6VTS5_9STRA|nr:hypothetical protein DYB32_000593 [Aphanomyces invadans]
MMRFTTGDILIRKAHRGKLQEVIYLVKDIFVDVNYRNQNGCTPLHAAAASGQLEVVQWLLNVPEMKPAVDDVRVELNYALISWLESLTTTTMLQSGQTALHYAAFYGHLEVVLALVEHGIPLNLKDKYACPPTHHPATERVLMDLLDKKFVHAAEDGNDDEIKRIIMDVNHAYPLRFLKDKVPVFSFTNPILDDSAIQNGKNAMHWAAGSGHLSTLRILAESFDVWTDVDKVRAGTSHMHVDLRIGQFGRNVLHWAALGGHKDCALWLIKHTRDPNALQRPTLVRGVLPCCSGVPFAGGGRVVEGVNDDDVCLQAWEKGNAEYAMPDDDVSSFKSKDQRPSPNAQVSQNRDIISVRNWLKQLELGEYTEYFEKDGFDTLRGVATIDEGDLIEMNVKKGILQHIQELKNQLAAYDEQAQSNGVEPDALPTLSMLPQLVKTPSSTQLQTLMNPTSQSSGSSVDGATNAN